MTESDTQLEFETDPIREEYNEYDAESGVIAVITDPENQLAWIKSNVTCDIEA